MNDYVKILSTLIGCAAALAGTLVLTPAAGLIARTLGIVDRPDGERKLQKRPVSLLGGVAVCLGLLLGIAALSTACSLPTYAAQFPGLLAGVAILCAVGVLDDVWVLKARWKLVGQIISTLPIVYAGFAIERIGIRSYAVELGCCAMPLTVLWLVVAINALNLIDGMDGLASVTGLCMALGVSATGCVTGADETVRLALVLVGTLAGFLAFNFPPASIYLGDAGSMVIGLVLGVLSFEVAEDWMGYTSLPVMLVLMAVPLGDTALAILRRWLSGRGIFHGDRGHIHHRLLDQGFSPRRVLAIVAAICCLTGALVVLARTADWDGAAWVASLVLAAALIRTRIMGYYEWALLKTSAARRLAILQDRLPAPAVLSQMPFDLTWQRLASAAARLPIRRMQLTVHDGEGSMRHHHWAAPHAQLPTSLNCAIEIKSSTPLHGWCVLHVEPTEGTHFGRQWIPLLNALEQLARHFAQHPDQVPGASLRLHDPDPSPDTLFATPRSRAA